jgi:isopentenyl phosphate kinase
MRHSVIILKLGGSILTDKLGRKPILNSRVARRLVREISTYRRHSSRGFILLHGGGSFGHPLAHRYDLTGKKLGPQSLVGVGATIASMRDMGTQLAQLFIKANVPVVPLQTSAIVRKERGATRFIDYSVIERVLEHGGIPLLGGDVVFDGDRSAIVSADELAVALAQNLTARTILFATNVAGVYERFPTPRGARPLKTIDRSDLQRLLASVQERRSRSDVTGGMMGKLRSLIPLRDCEVLIFDGRIPGACERALRTRAGTKITL